MTGEKHEQSDSSAHQGRWPLLAGQLRSADGLGDFGQRGARARRAGDGSRDVRCGQSNVRPLRRSRRTSCNKRDRRRVASSARRRFSLFRPRSSRRRRRLPRCARGCRISAITRLARLTGLDEVGIPVWAAIRPNAATLAVSQGKGVDDDAAAASAMMEAIEVATAERRDLPHLTLSPRAMAASGRRAAPLTELLRVGASPPAPDESIDWIEGFDLMDDAPVWVPLDAVRLGEDAAQARYWQSTDGLASGNVLWEAAFHGLCERVERDALTLWSLAGDAEVGPRCRDPRDFDDPELAALVGQDRSGRASPAPVRHFDRRRDPRLLRRDLAAARQRSGALAPFRPAERQRLPSRSGARRHSRRHRSGAVAPDRDLRRARRFRSRRLPRADRARPAAVRPGRALGPRAGRRAPSRPPTTSATSPRA